MTHRPSIFAEPGHALKHLYRLWRECRRLERERGVPTSRMAIVFYQRVGELFAPAEQDDDDASAAGTQEITTTTTMTSPPPPSYIPRRAS